MERGRWRKRRGPKTTNMPSGRFMFGGGVSVVKSEGPRLYKTRV